MTLVSFFFRVFLFLAVTGTLAHADEEWSSLYFDLSSLIWMLIGALLWGLGSNGLRWYASRRFLASNDPAPGSVASEPVSVPAAGLKKMDSERVEGNEILSEYLTPLDETTTVTVEELSNVVEQVDLFLLLGRHEMATSLLLARIKDGDNDPRIWFKLLDIYHEHKDVANFDKLANDIRQYFNVALPTMEDLALQAEERHGLERFPHLLARISDEWGSSSCVDFLRSLIKDKRSGERAGFNEDAFREVMLLIGIIEQKSDLQ